jgi:ribosomal protein S18 acetylase RimI-like enzyme
MSVMTFGEAERLHDGLVAAFRALTSVLDEVTYEERDGYRLVACPQVPIPGLCGLWIDGPDDAGLAGALGPSVAEVEAMGVPCWVQLRAAVMPAVEKEAHRLGFTEEDRTPGMVVTPHELLAPGTAGIEIVRVDDAAGLATAADVAATGFGMPAEMTTRIYTSRLLELPSMQIYLGFDRNVPVSTAIGFGTGSSVGLFNVATPPEHRGKGFGGAISAEAASAGFRAGGNLAWLQASESGRSLYRKLGFRQVETYLVLGRPQAG